MVVKRNQSKRPKSRTYEPDVPSPRRGGTTSTTKTTTTKTTATKPKKAAGWAVKPTVKAAGWAMDVASYPGRQTRKAVTAGAKGVVKAAPHVVKPRGPLSGIAKKSGQLAKRFGQTYK